MTAAVPPPQLIHDSFTPVTRPLSNGSVTPRMQALSNVKAASHAAGSAGAGTTPNQTPGVVHVSNIAVLSGEAMIFGRSRPSSLIAGNVSVSVQLSGTTMRMRRVSSFTRTNPAGTVSTGTVVGVAVPGAVAAVVVAGGAVVLVGIGMVPAIVVFAAPPVEGEDAPAVAKPVAMAATADCERDATWLSSRHQSDASPARVGPAQPSRAMWRVGSIVWQRDRRPLPSSVRLAGSHAPSRRRSGPTPSPGSPPASRCSRAFSATRTPSSRSSRTRCSPDTT